LARALCGNPRLVVLDEPNASLDFPAEQALCDAIESVKASGAIVVVITHRTGILAATDKIAIMQAGALVAVGRREDIVERHLKGTAGASGDRRPARIASKTRDEATVETISRKPRPRRPPSRKSRLLEGSSK
jgi:ABC-type protease/lipase transport system fused ATPase/permease subunit